MLKPRPAYPPQAADDRDLDRFSRSARRPPGTFWPHRPAPQPGPCGCRSAKAHCRDKDDLLTAAGAVGPADDSFELGKKTHSRPKPPAISARTRIAGRPSSKGSRFYAGGFRICSPRPTVSVNSGRRGRRRHLGRRRKNRSPRPTQASTCSTGPNRRKSGDWRSRKSTAG